MTEGAVMLISRQRSYSHVGARCTLTPTCEKSGRNKTGAALTAAPVRA